MRLKEGFSFAHSVCGIITMVLELQMSSTMSCVVQYVIFPPHNVAISEGDNYSYTDNDQDLELENEYHQIVTEIWIEPQYGIVLPDKNPMLDYLEKKYYYELSEEIMKNDWNCINSLLTLEHLSLMCQHKDNIFSIRNITNININKKCNNYPNINEHDIFSSRDVTQYV